MRHTENYQITLAWYQSIPSSDIQINRGQSCICGMAKIGEEKAQGDGTKKVSSHYELNASDNPGSLITQVQLKGENYEEWAKAVRISLRARRKWGFVDGTHKEPETDAPEMEDWWTVQSMIVSWILNTIEPNLRSTITYVENAKDLWEDIKERFAVVNGPRIQQLKAELADCKQQGSTMVAYYSKLKTLWDELINYEKTLQCTCSGCTCGVVLKLEKRREEEKVHQFLMGLDDTSYGAVRSSVLATDPLPSLNRVYAIMVQEERMKSITRTKEEKGMVVGLAVQAGSKNKGRREAKDKSVVCSHCGKTGHDAKGCFQIIGYPEWWGDRSRTDGGTSEPRQGSSGGRGRGSAARANVAHVFGGSCSAPGTKENNHEIAGLSNEQWQTLMTMIKSHNTSNTETMTGKKACDWWIIDSGASNHMTGRLQNLCDKRVIQNCPSNSAPIALVVEEEPLRDIDLPGGIDTEHDAPPPSEQVVDPPTPASDAEPTSSPTSLIEAPLGRGHRLKKPPIKLQEYVTHATIQLSPSDRSPLSSDNSGVLYPLEKNI
ncbi:Zinc finger, CCHC-type [Sesbania bispinosa]|nr:Zinc finger, CCHC-type [Sesbania bispinosa]